MAAVNSVRYGLAGSIWTNDLTRAHRVAARVEVICCAAIMCFIISHCVRSLVSCG